MIDLVTRLNGTRTLVYDHLIGLKERSKKYYDRTINPGNFSIGDYVFLLKGPKPNKFGDHHLGSHKILEIIEKNNIKILYKKENKIVHANRLRISYLNHTVNLKRNERKNVSDD